MNTNKSIEQQAVCICTDLWSVKTTNTYKQDTLVSAKTATEAKTKVLRYLSGKKTGYVWPQHTPYI